MTAWRMAFRDGKDGPSLWPQCRDLGIAAIQYDEMDGIDLAQYERREPKHAWRLFARATARSASLDRFAYEMKPGDEIFVKEGKTIVGRGIVAGPYQFEKLGRLCGPKNGNPWEHQRRVNWDPQFAKVNVLLGKAQQYTVEKLTDEDVARIRDVGGPRLNPEDAEVIESSDDETYIPREGDARTVVERQIRVRRGQQQFRNALRERYGDSCLITGCTILDLLEAAHIKPYRGDDDNHPENGLLLRTDIHTLFDLNLLGIEPESLEVQLHPRVALDSEYGDLAGKILHCARKRQPSPVALRQRYEEFRQQL